MTRLPRLADEQLIGALVPSAPLKPPPRPAPMPPLAALRHCVETGTALLLGMAQPDRSGRITERALLAALRWTPGHRLDMDASDGMLFISSTSTGSHVVGDRGGIALPGALRALCGIRPGQAVVLAAMAEHDLLIIHPTDTVTRLLTSLHSQITGAGHDS